MAVESRPPASFAQHKQGHTADHHSTRVPSKRALSDMADRMHMLHFQLRSVSPSDGAEWAAEWAGRLCVMYVSPFDTQYRRFAIGWFVAEMIFTWANCTDFSCFCYLFHYFLSWRCNFLLFFFLNSSSGTWSMYNHNQIKAKKHYEMQNIYIFLVCYNLMLRILVNVLHK